MSMADDIEHEPIEIEAGPMHEHGRVVLRWAEAGGIRYAIQIPASAARKLARELDRSASDIEWAESVREADRRRKADELREG